MATSARELVVRDQLLQRRGQLESALTGGLRSPDLARLLGEVDSALARLSQGRYGVCEVCGGQIEDEHLAADPLARTCLDDMAPDERRALQRDLDLTARIQEDLLPRRQQAFAGWETAFHYEPLSTVSGDCGDLVLRDGTLHFLLGDVAGKGVAASMLMAHLQAAFRTLVSMDVPVTDLLERANRVFCESVASGRYATLVCGRADASGEIELASAGHLPVLWLKETDVERVGATGLPVGLFCGTRYGSARVTLAPGESLLLYTDGLSEMRDPRGEEYGIERLAAVARRHRAAPASELVATVLADAAAYRDGTPRADDLTLLAIRRLA